LLLNKKLRKTHSESFYLRTNLEFWGVKKSRGGGKRNFPSTIKTKFNILGEDIAFFTPHISKKNHTCVGSIFLFFLVSILVAKLAHYKLWTNSKFGV
jgi:hypothetical protein